MRRPFLLLIGLLVAVSIQAQQQKGIVKTRGKMVSGQLQPGTRLASATVRVEGVNAMTSEENGEVSFKPRAKTYRLQSVQKNGYQLVDLDVCCNHDCSPDPLYLLMETPDQLLADQQAKERSLRRQLSKKLEEREDEIEKLKVSLEEKNHLINELDQQREENQKIIKSLAKYYTTIDFDQLDDFQRQVSNLLEQGEAEQALALLRSRGDLKSNISDYRQKEEALRREKEEKATNFLYASQAHLMIHQNDSALAYLKGRVELDSLNIDWLNDVGEMLSEYMSRYDDALTYYRRALDLSRRQHGERDVRTATCLNNIGVVYYYQGRYQETLDYFQQALDIKQQALGQDNIDVASYLNNIGNVYTALKQLDQALTFHQQALGIRRQLLGEEHPDVAISLNNIGSVYRDQHHFDQALDSYQQALDIRQRLLGSEDPATATSHNNIALVYQHQKNLPLALEHQQQALAIRETIYGKQHSLIATSCNNIGTVYYLQGDTAQALNYLLRALDIRERLLGPQHLTTGKTYNNLAAIYKALGDRPRALDYYQRALDAYLSTLGPKDADVKKLQQKIKDMKKQP